MATTQARLAVVPEMKKMDARGDLCKVYRIPYKYVYERVELALAYVGLDIRFSNIDLGRILAHERIHTNQFYGYIDATVKELSYGTSVMVHGRTYGDSVTVGLENLLLGFFQELEELLLADLPQERSILRRLDGVPSAAFEQGRNYPYVLKRPYPTKPLLATGITVVLMGLFMFLADALDYRLAFRGIWPWGLILTVPLLLAMWHLHDRNHREAIEILTWGGGMAVIINMIINLFIGVVAVFPLIVAVAYAEEVAQWDDFYEELSEYDSRIIDYSRASEAGHV
jgi:hypothetical protein